MLCGKCQTRLPAGYQPEKPDPFDSYCIGNFRNMTFNLFVLPFVLGLIFLIFSLIKKSQDLDQ